jgi:hypothetical protein
MAGPPFRLVAALEPIDLHSASGEHDRRNYASIKRDPETSPGVPNNTATLLGAAK